MMKLEVGKYYKCRNGEIVGPLIKTPEHWGQGSEWGFAFVHPDGVDLSFNDDGAEDPFAKSEWDIVEEVYIDATVSPSVKVFNYAMTDEELKQASMPSPYRRTLPTYEDGTSDVYTVLKGYEVTCPAIAHAVKKLLAPGCRSGGKSYTQDLEEAMQSIQKAIELEKIG